MSAPKVWRVAFVNTHPIQYFAPLYAYLNRDPELDITAIYCSDFSLRGAVDPGFGRNVKWDVDLLSGYRPVFLGKRAHKRTPRGFFSLVCPQIWGEIRSGRYDAIVLHGYNFASHMLAFLAAKSRGLPVFIRGDTHLRKRRPSWRRLARTVIVGALFRKLSGCLSIGTANHEYYRSLGIPDSRIFFVPFAVDNDRFIAAARLTAEQRHEVRSRYGLRQDLPLVVFAAKFDPFKHPLELIDAMAKLRASGVDAALLMVGSGQLEKSLHERVRLRRLTDVKFAGFVNQAEMPAVLGAADLFALPAENEAWGLVVNEAMCAGLPVIVGDEVGCVPDLVRDGVNGHLVRAGDVESLTAALQDVLSSDQRRQELGRKSFEMIQRWSYAECLVGIKAALAAQAGTT